MLKTRVIPCLLLREGGLVKTEKFKNHKYIGDPINAVRIFNEKEVDELIFLDIDASRDKQQPNLEVIRELATECFMPFAYGGGVRTIEHITNILKAGVEKVVINQEALHNLSFVESAARHFGSSTIIVAIDIKKDFWGHYKVYDHVKGKATSIDPVAFAKQVEQAGAGEIFLNNVDRDGTFSGFDHHVINLVNSAINIPLIVCGGASGLDDIQKVVKSTGVSAVAAGSLFVYQGPHRAVLISYPQRKDLESLLK
jgi:imidazole glycerol-phosphate synthase subunit HisF